MEIATHESACNSTFDGVVTCALLLIAVSMGACGDTVGPGAIPVSEAAAHIGETMTVEGRIANVFTSDQGNTFLNFGDRHPRQTFSAVIFAREASLFSGVHGLDGRKVQISGRISLYEGKPQIILKDASQLRAL